MGKDDFLKECYVYVEALRLSLVFHVERTMTSKAQREESKLFRNLMTEWPFLLNKNRGVQEMKTGEASKGKRLYGLISHIKELGLSPKNFGDHLRVLRNLENGLKEGKT